MTRNAQLKAAIFEAGLTQCKLSHLARVPRAYLSLALHGRLNLTAEEKARISKVLGTPEDRIFPEGAGAQPCHRKTNRGAPRR